MFLAGLVITVSSKTLKKGGPAERKKKTAARNNDVGGGSWRYWWSESLQYMDVDSGRNFYDNISNDS